MSQVLRIHGLKGKKPTVESRGKGREVDDITVLKGEIRALSRTVELLEQVSRKQVEQIHQLQTALGQATAAHAELDVNTAWWRDLLLDQVAWMETGLADLEAGKNPDPKPKRGNPASYVQQVLRLRTAVNAQLPADATVIMVSRGDEALVRLGPRRAWHFPQDEAGTYAGNYPATSAVAIAQLEQLRAKGGDYLVFPLAALWWLDHYPAFKRHLERGYRLAFRRDDTCWIFALGEPSPWREAGEFTEALMARRRRCPAILNWTGGVDLAKIFPECPVFAPMAPEMDQLPYLEGSIDIVAVRSNDPARIQEARRVAAEAVWTISPESALGSLRVTVEPCLNQLTSAPSPTAPGRRPTRTTNRLV